MDNNNKKKVKKTRTDAADTEKMHDMIATAIAKYEAGAKGLKHTKIFFSICCMKYSRYNRSIPHMDFHAEAKKI